MPYRIILVRHGETEYNKKRIVQGQLDVPLNSNGKNQAKKVGHILRTKQINSLFSSDLLRALQTAEEIGLLIQLPIINRRHLRERDFGILQGKSAEEVEKECAGFLTYGSIALKGKESIFKVETDEMIIDRLKIFIEEIKNNHKNQTICIVAHGGSIRLLLYLLGVFPYEKAKHLFISNTFIFELIKKEKNYILI